MRRVTRDVDLADARDLLERVPRACLCVVDDDGPRATPVALVWRDGRHLVGIGDGAGAGPSPGQEVVLLVDEGIQWFELRAVYIRGAVTPTEAPPGAATDRSWFEVTPRRSVAWDYGRLREVSDDA